MHRVDSDEHDEYGHITEDLKVNGIRAKMTEKRIFKKSKLIQQHILAPELVGPEKYEMLVIS